MQRVTLTAWNLVAGIEGPESRWGLPDAGDEAELPNMWARCLHFMPLQIEFSGRVKGDKSRLGMSGRCGVGGEKDEG